jgi:hypothetical protein
MNEQDQEGTTLEDRVNDRLTDLGIAITDLRRPRKLLDIAAIRAFLAQVVTQYEQTAPTVSRWADELYIRLGEDLSCVRVVELVTAAALFEEGQWEHPNFAASRIYHLMESLGQDVTGHAGF